jgi:stage IV sporulation protein FB
VFVFFGAGGEAAAVETRLAGRGLEVSQMMITRFRSLPTHATLQEAVDALLEGEQREFPVVDNWGKVEGMLTRENLIRGLAERGPGSIVDQAVTRPVTSVSPGLPFADALERLRQSGLPALPVVDGAGTLVGLLTMDNISDLLLVRRAQVTPTRT